VRRLEGTRFLNATSYIRSGSKGNRWSATWAVSPDVADVAGDPVRSVIATYEITHPWKGKDIH